MFTNDIIVIFNTRTVHLSPSTGYTTRHCATLFSQFTIDTPQ